MQEWEYCFVVRKRTDKTFGKNFAWYEAYLLTVNGKKHLYNSEKWEIKGGDDGYHCVQNFLARLGLDGWQPYAGDNYIFSDRFFGKNIHWVFLRSTKE